MAADTQDFTARLEAISQGALGRLEQLALRIACILGQDRPVLQQPQMLVFAADHGLAARGV
ncbi:nicotinate-nucleotide--dimethylbenzimidazole phosphoribosyltransferase, partial [Vibrio cholerae O1]|nr:nicotinate-nucleotide--dimethylbenzimidazole phosphoribosyltransferase [Vibrio cholerae O1]